MSRVMRIPTHAATALQRFSAAVVAGAVTGLVVGGVGGRLAMLVLRLTSGPGVNGVVSDDGFVMGRVTLSGTLSLLGVATAIGVLGALVHRLVVPWLIGPRWFRRLTTAAGSGIVVGAMLVHTTGVDFTRLRPVGLAIALFVAVPALYGALIGPVQEYCDRPDSWLNRHPVRRWAVPVVTVGVLFPLAPFLVVLFLVTWAWTASSEGLSWGADWTRAQPVAAVVARVPWVAIVALGLADLVRDATTLA